MREQLIHAVIAHAEGQLAVHETNVEVYLHNPAGIGEHSDVVEAITSEVEKMAHWHDFIETMQTYFIEDSE